MKEASRSEEAPVTLHVATASVESVCRAAGHRKKSTLLVDVRGTAAGVQRPPHMASQSLCEAFSQEGDQRASEALCTLRSSDSSGWTIGRFVSSADSEKYIEHRFRPINEAARQHKKKLQETLELLKQKLHF